MLYYTLNEFLMKVYYINISCPKFAELFYFVESWVKYINYFIHSKDYSWKQIQKFSRLNLPRII